MAARPDKPPLPSVDVLSSLREDGSRRFLFPADVSGRFTHIRNVTFALLGALLFALPWLSVGGHPAVMLDISARTLYVLGRAFRAQDTFLLFFLVSGVGFGLVATTTLFGRLWCGFACPQTVFVEGVFRRLERWVEGPAAARRKLAEGPWTGEKLVKRLSLHAAYLAAATLIAHTILGYFFPIRSLFGLLAQGPLAHPVAFLWTTAVTALCYFDFGFFREQFCIVMCPYGRLQSTMTDPDTRVVGYDVVRGEPRGKLHVLQGATGGPPPGDCIDCRRCVAVCPTGIDIRHGLSQLECVGCMACIDACDEVMTKVNRPVGLVRFDSEKGFAGQPSRLVRPRTLAYAAAGLAGLLVAGTVLARSPTVFEATVGRPLGAPYVVEDGRLRNMAHLHVVSKSSSPLTLTVSADAAGFEALLPAPTVTLSPLGAADIPIVLSSPWPAAIAHRDAVIHLTDAQSGERHDLVLRINTP